MLLNEIKIIKNKNDNLVQEAKEFNSKMQSL